jgi:UDP-N-acetyl-D-galactosamine dehydrogenase
MPVVVDPWASDIDAMHEYGVELTKLSEVQAADCIILAVAHNEFKTMSIGDIYALFKNTEDNSEKVLIDVKGALCLNKVAKEGFRYWRL